MLPGLLSPIPYVVSQQQEWEEHHFHYPGGVEK